MECSCCGEERATVALRSHDDVQLCRVCVEWLAGQLGVTSTPTLPVLNMDDAIAFYERAGFSVRRYVDETASPGDFAFVEYDEQSVFDLAGFGSRLVGKRTVAARTCRVDRISK